MLLNKKKKTKITKATATNTWEMDLNTANNDVQNRVYFNEEAKHHLKILKHENPGQTEIY